MVGLVDVLECEKVYDSDILDGYSFAIYSNVRRECVGDLESVGEMFGNMDGDECFQVVKEEDGGWS